MQVVLVGRDVTDGSLGFFLAISRHTHPCFIPGLISTMSSLLILNILVLSVTFLSHLPLPLLLLLFTAG